MFLNNIGIKQIDNIKVCDEIYMQGNNTIKKERIDRLDFPLFFLRGGCPLVK